MIEGAVWKDSPGNSPRSEVEVALFSQRVCWLRANVPSDGSCASPIKAFLTSGIAK